MSIDFIKAKNGTLTCRENSIFLHSSYAPETEAERFADNLQIDFNPAYIVIIEPALSYSAAYLRKYPDTKIGAVRFSDEFKKYDSNWDFVFYYDTEKDFSQEFYNFSGEDGFFSTAFFTWPPSKKAYEILDVKIWDEIRQLSKKCQSVLATREYFSKRWLKNKITFLSSIKRTGTISKGNSVIVVAASGPSLENAIDSIKKKRGNIFLIAVSSALSVLLYNNIVPDLCISTDGGYWAKKHLECLFKDNNITGQSGYSIPLALSAESSCPKVLFNSLIIPLCYDDDYLSNLFYKKMNLKFMKGKRNGTVSGTALELALELTDNKIFFAGLDLAPASGYQHAQPNMLETGNSVHDFRLQPKENRIGKQSLPAASLKIYEEWFRQKSFSLNGRVFRINGTDVFKNTLGMIKDIRTDFFEMCCIEKKEKPCININMIKNENPDFFHNLMDDYLNTPQFLKDMFPAKNILLERASSKKEKERIFGEIEIKKKELLEKIYGNDTTRCRASE